MIFNVLIMSLIIEYVKNNLQSFIGHESLFQNFSNRQTAFYIFASGKLRCLSFLNYIPQTLNFFSDESYLPAGRQVEILPQSPMPAIIGIVLLNYC